MFPRALLSVILSLVLASCAARAEKPILAAGAAQLSLPKEPEFQPIEDVAGLPRVLLIGDSISVGYTLPVRQRLAGRANLHRILANAGATRDMLARFDEWMGTAKWDVIHFNCGLHDLKLTANGSPNVSLAEYEQNLRDLVARLRPLAKHLVWCSTTPVPGTDLDPPRRNADVIAYNEAAQRVMTESGVLIDDLDAFVWPQADRIRKPLNVHFTPKGCVVLGQQVARCIEQVLAIGTGSPSK